MTISNSSHIPMFIGKPCILIPAQIRVCPECRNISHVTQRYEWSKLPGLRARQLYLMVNWGPKGFPGKWGNPFTKISHFYAFRSWKFKPKIEKKTLKFCIFVIKIASLWIIEKFPIFSQKFLFAGNPRFAYTS